MSDIRTKWESGKSSEVAFWKQVAGGEVGKFEQWRQNMIGRAREEAPFMSALAQFLPSNVSRAAVVDMAAGPVSCVGWNYRGQRINVTPIDALAGDYDRILADAGIIPAVRTRSGEAERVDEIFAPSSIDLVYIRNALDHCYDVPRVIKAAVSILKPSGYFVVHSYRNEAEFENYSGLHQWNITTERGHFIVHRPGVRISVSDLVAGLASVTIMKDEEKWIEVAIRKAGTHLG